MPPVDRFFGVAIYSILNFVPFTLLAVYPFRRSLRFSETVTVILIVLLSLIQIALRAAAVFGGEDKGMLTGLATLAYAVFYFIVVRAHPGKMIFTLLVLYNIADLVVIDSKCIEGLIFGADMALQSYRWTASFTMLIVSMLVLLPLAVYFRKYYAVSINRQPKGSPWNYLWLIPATFYLVWFCYCYGRPETALEIALEPSSAVLTLLINMGAFLVYHTVLRMINEQEINRQLAAQNYNLSVQSLQLENLQKQIKATRQARHDLRHHITVMNSYLAAGEYDRLREYLKSYKKSLPDDSGQAMCGNYAVNTLLQFFRQRAEQSSIEFSVEAELPEQAGVPDHIMSVLLGNLLENAVEACMRSRTGQAWIRVKIRKISDAVFFQVENTCDEAPVRLEDGAYVSSKRSGDKTAGIGLESVGNIAEQYDGMMETEYSGGCFRVSVILNTED